MVKKAEKELLKKAKKETLKQVQNDKIAVQPGKVEVKTDKVKVKKAKAPVKPKEPKFVDKYNLGGRPRAFSSPEEMAKEITAYFEQCAEHMSEKVTKSGFVVTVKDPKWRRQNAMCNFMGITTTTLQKYRNGDYGDGYKQIIDMALQYIEDDYVELGSTTPAGSFAQFVLRNNFEGWDKKNEPDNNITVNSMPTVKVGGKELEINIGDDSEK